jgi:hypothetical protein
VIRPQRSDAPNLLVYWWWLAESSIPGVLPAERRFWRLVFAARHPRTWWVGWRHWRNRPGVGDQVRDCRGEIHTVASIRHGGDGLVLEDGHACSWMNCCDPTYDEILKPDPEAGQ